MRIKNSIKYLIIVAIIGIAIASCKKRKDTPTPVDSDTSGASENALAQNSFDDVSNIADQAAGGILTTYLAPNNAGNYDRGVLSCANISIDTINGPDHFISVSFPTSGCLGADNKTRKGTIMIHFNGHYHDINSSHWVEFINYYVDDNQINGTDTIVNKGFINGHLSFKVTVNAYITKANGGGTMVWHSIRTRDLINDNSTPDNLSDDVYSITGTSWGTNSNGTTFNETITSALHMHMDCTKSKIESGKILMQISGKPDRTMDFGVDNTCDHTATVTIDGHTYDISI